MASIITQVGTLNFNENLGTIEPIPLSRGAFTNALTDEMNSARDRIKDKSIQLAKVLFVSSSDLSTMIDTNKNAEVLIFYLTDGGETTTFTVISADRSLNPKLLDSDGKWKLKVTLGYEWQLGVVNAKYNPFRTTDITDIYNPLLPAYSHKLESVTKFFTDLEANSEKLLAAIDNGTLPHLRIAVALKEDLKVFTKTEKYSGILLYLNDAAQDRIVPETTALGEVPLRTKFVSLSILGVDQNWEPLAVKNEEKITLRGICPPDCPTYNTAL